MTDKADDTPGEARARLREAAQQQSRFLAQLGDKESALEQLVAEVHRWPESEQAQLLERCLRNLERERELLEGFQQTIDTPDLGDIDGALANLRHARQCVHTSPAQERIDQALAAPSDKTPDERALIASQRVEQSSSVLTRPMRIQDLFGDAQPPEWRIEPRGEFSAYPEGAALHAGPLHDGSGWYWIASRPGLHATGTASTAAIAVASAEAAYHLMLLG